jgi:CheY-like chemotaxis protein
MPGVTQSAQIAGRVLIADDNAAMRDMLARFCRDCGAKVTVCNDGAAAVQAYDRLQPDWVLMDAVMPVLDGLAATARIHARFPDARIVIISEHDLDSLRQAAQQAGACAYVMKDNLLDLPATLGSIGGTATTPVPPPPPIPPH